MDILTSFLKRVQLRYCLINYFMNRGYIIPVILVVLLVVLAGYILFLTPVHSPSDQKDVYENPVLKATSTQQDILEQEDIEDEQNTSTTTNIDTSDLETENQSTSTDTI